MLSLILTLQSKTILDVGVHSSKCPSS